MQAKIIQKQEPKTFKPVTIEITLESIDEVAELYARFNIAPSELQNSYPSEFRGCKNNRPYDLFNIIQDVYNENK